MMNKGSFIKFMHISDRDPCRMQITPQHNSLKTRKLASELPQADI